MRCPWSSGTGCFATTTPWRTTISGSRGSACARAAAFAGALALALAGAGARADEPAAEPPSADTAPAAEPTERAPPEASFADALFAEGDFYRAIGEYKRALHLHPDAPQTGAWMLRIGEAYLKGGQEKAAAEHFASLALKRPDLARAARLQAARARLRAGDAATAESELKLWLADPAEPAPGAVQPVDAPAFGPIPSAGGDRLLLADGRRLLGWALLKQSKDAEAADAFAASGAPALAEKTRALAKLPYKDPWLAGALSLIPGVGHFYIEDPAVGLAALVWNALFGWATFDAFRRGDYGTAAVLATFESIWYGGAIVGAIGGAFRYNRDLRRNAVDEMEKEGAP